MSVSSFIETIHLVLFFVSSLSRFPIPAANMIACITSSPHLLYSVSQSNLQDTWLSVPHSLLGTAMQSSLQSFGFLEVRC